MFDRCAIVKSWAAAAAEGREAGNQRPTDGRRGVGSVPPPIQPPSRPRAARAHLPLAPLQPHAALLSARPQRRWSHGRNGLRHAHTHSWSRSSPRSAEAPTLWSVVRGVGCSIEAITRSTLSLTPPPASYCFCPFLFPLLFPPPSSLRPPCPSPSHAPLKRSEQLPSPPPPKPFPPSPSSS